MKKNTGIKDTTSFIMPFSVSFDLEEGIMAAPDRHLVRRASAMEGYYLDSEAHHSLVEDGDPVHYEVFEKPVAEEYGHIMYCVSSLRPGRVGDEFFMTKGHYHTVLETGELYLCLRGEGYMAMKTRDNQFAAERMSRGGMVYVPPYWAHRSINTGSDKLISLCVYPAEAGHNYGDIEAEGFLKRCFFCDGEILFK